MDPWVKTARRILREYAWLNKISDPDERDYWWRVLVEMQVYFS